VRKKRERKRRERAFSLPQHFNTSVSLLRANHSAYRQNMDLAQTYSVSTIERKEILITEYR